MLLLPFNCNVPSRATVQFSKINPEITRAPINRELPLTGGTDRI